MKKAILVIVFLLLAMAGCSGKNTKDSPKEHADKKPVEIAKGYQDIYDKACEDGKLDDLATIRQIVERLGEDGLVAVDAKNLVDMENASQAEAFCKRASEGKEAAQTIIAVKDDGGFIRYDLQALDGTLKVGYVTWSKGEPVEKGTDEYQAYAWSYSSKGYLFFEKYQPPGYDGFSGHTAIRVKPLDQDCRELNQKYIIPVGYYLNNLFLEDWSENDYGDLNFYDIFEPMYQMKYGKRLDVEFAFTGKTYNVPEKEFEDVFLTFFQIDPAMLRQKTTYDEVSHTYQYRPRGMFDFGSTPDIPYPEVVAYEAQENGTIKLVVDAVWPDRNMDKAYSHEVVVRPLDGGRFQYVSNHVIDSEDNAEPIWYRERLSDEKWDEYYGD